MASQWFGSIATLSSGRSGSESVRSSSRWWKKSSKQRWERSHRSESENSAAAIGTGITSGR